jgi:hypothetical protein
MQEWEERMKRNAEPTAVWARRWHVAPGRLGNEPGATTYTGYAGYVRPGWISILDRLAEDLVALGWDRTLHQVKQKFGGLSFYVGRRDPMPLGKEAHDAIDRRIDEARAESFKTCEECGAPGRTGNPGESGWLMTLCSRCFEVENAAARARAAELEREEAEARAHEEPMDPEYRALLGDGEFWRTDGEDRDPEEPR